MFVRTFVCMPTSMASLHYFHLRDMKYDYISCTLVLAFRSCFITRFLCLCVFTNQERDDDCRYLSQGCTPCDRGCIRRNRKGKQRKISAVEHVARKTLIFSLQQTTFWSRYHPTVNLSVRNCLNIRPSVLSTERQADRPTNR